MVSADGFDPGSRPPVSTRLETFDGLVVTVQGWRVEDDFHFAFAAEGGDMAETINARTQGWIYSLPDYKADQLIRRMSDLLAAEE